MVLPVYIRSRWRSYITMAVIMITWFVDWTILCLLETSFVTEPALLISSGLRLDTLPCTELISCLEVAVWKLWASWTVPKEVAPKRPRQRHISSWICKECALTKAKRPKRQRSLDKPQISPILAAMCATPRYVLINCSTPFFFGHHSYHNKTLTNIAGVDVKSKWLFRWRQKVD